MLNRIAVPFLAMSLLALPALAADPSPKAPVASPAKVVAASPKPTATPSKSASTTKKHHRVARNHAHVTRPTTPTASKDAAKPPVATTGTADKTAKSTVTK